MQIERQHGCQMGADTKAQGVNRFCFQDALGNGFEASEIQARGGGVQVGQADLQAFCHHRIATRAGRTPQRPTQFLYGLEDRLQGALKSFRHACT